MKVSLISAMSQNRIIGKEGHLPWQHIAADWDNLFKVTSGRKMIMGRKSYDNPDRISSPLGNIVISRQKNYVVEPGFILANSLAEAFEHYKNEEEVFVLGGEEIYRQALPFADLIYLTIVHETFEGDAFFPEFDEKTFKIIERKEFKAGTNTPYDLSILTYQSLRNPSI